jgi:23S rRNA (adenine1618-N6)-methyltransferase
MENGNNTAPIEPQISNLTQLPPYTEINFKILAKKDEAFKKVWQKCSGRLDFQDPETLQALTRATLKADFGLEVDLPDNRLCPPVPNRWNYVSWIQSLIDSTSPTYTSHYDPDRKVTGLDIGTGASAIYTLLCLRTRPNWTMCCTDVDKKSFDSAARNLALNNMLTRTKMLQTMETNALIPLKFLGVEKLDFTICNPPFFADEEDMRASIKGEGKSWSPNAICTGSDVEMVCPGGDLGFVTRMVEESLKLRDKVTWYSSMLGKMSSAKAIVDLLKKKGVTNWALGCLEPGPTTKRWVVAWSFGDYRPRNDIARMEAIANEYLPFPTSYKIPLAADQTLPVAKEAVNKNLGELDLRWEWDATTSTGVGVASQNVWKRAYRRQHEKKMKDQAGSGKRIDDELMRELGDTEEVAIAFRVHVLDVDAEIEESARVVVDWLRGSDKVLWESLCGAIHGYFRKR